MSFIYGGRTTAATFSPLQRLSECPLAGPLLPHQASASNAPPSYPEILGQPTATGAAVRMEHLLTDIGQHFRSLNRQPLYGQLCLRFVKHDLVSVLPSLTCLDARQHIFFFIKYISIQSPSPVSVLTLCCTFSVSCIPLAAGTAHVSYWTSSKRHQWLSPACLDRRFHYCW